MFKNFKRIVVERRGSSLYMKSYQRHNLMLRRLVTVNVITGYSGV